MSHVHNSVHLFQKYTEINTNKKAINSWNSVFIAFIYYYCFSSFNMIDYVIALTIFKSIRKIR